MHICVFCVHIYICIYACTHEQIEDSMHTCIFVCSLEEDMYACVFLCMCVHMHTHIHVFIYVYIYTHYDYSFLFIFIFRFIFIFICIFIFMYTHIYIYIIYVRVMHAQGLQHWTFPVSLGPNPLPASWAHMCPASSHCARRRGAPPGFRRSAWGKGKLLVPPGLAANGFQAFQPCRDFQNEPKTS